MKKQLFKDALLWGFVLWLFGYILGVIFFAFVPPEFIGWVITPFGVLFTIWVLFKKVKSEKFSDFILIAIAWSLIAIIFDYLLLVQVFHPADGYYKLDVYIYYLLTLLIPILFGWKKVAVMKNNSNLVK